MIIDDEEAIRKLLSRVLTGSGYDVVTASNGKDALGKLDSASVDLIMLDMNMPEMDGLQFLRKVRENDLTHVPVLIISGDANPENIVESYKLGVYDFIHKPEKTEVMLKRIENGLKIGEMINFNEFIRVELMMARKLQKYLFPNPTLKSSHASIHTWSLPLSDIGGDLFDYVLFRDDRVVFFVADVSGHSISAALYTAIVKMVFRNALQRSETPGELMAAMNRELSGNIPVESFVTAFCGIYNPDGRVLYYANAGHPKPYCITDKGFFALEGNDSFLGPIEDASYSTHHVEIPGASSILLFTDGILDIMGDNDMPVGNAMMADILTVADCSPIEKYSRIQEVITGGEVAVNDDCTLMLVELF